MRQLCLFGLGLVLLSSCSGGDNQAANKDTTTTTPATQETSTADTTEPAPATGAASFQSVMDGMMRDMHGMTMTQDPDHDFAMMMKRHHQGAVEMSQIELNNGTNAELKQVAQKIITDSQRDIADLDAFMVSHKANGKSSFAKDAMDQMMKGSMDMGQGSDTDQQFAMMMSMHHKSGIDMARLYLKSAREEQTRKVANSSIKANTEDNRILAKFAGNMGNMDMSGHDMKNMKGMDTMNHSGR